MIVDRRKDHYDELLVLARDARVSRARTNRWTTGLIIATMAASAAYIAATNNKVNELREAKDAADAEVEKLNVDLDRLLIDHEALRVERDVYKQNAEWFADLSPSLNAASRLGNIAAALGGVRPEPGQVTVQRSDFALSNLVWYVDGSRRFPMAAGDVLWIPEGQFWVRLEAPVTTGALPSRIFVYEGSRPSPDEPPTSEAEGPFRIDNGSYYERKVTREGSDCVTLEIGGRTGRPVFGPGYVDMVVTYTNKQEACANDVVTP